MKKKGKKVLLRDEFEVTVDSNILETIQKIPGAAEVMMKNGLPCVGCMAARFERISDIAKEFGIDSEKLVKEIKKIQNKNS